ncbi:hypothetical protein AOQ84DRAFT_299854 [Glonium stellatum]|uniref:DUF6594 domain-containing protein n=1 Tax=Glonium stellatum TaxID=574774 RepID=A0A8E2EUA4_9PEZI|nr:hypothetical protein AOQ84DRAFT_299854 [Glonium stellatum]
MASPIIGSGTNATIVDFNPPGAPSNTNPIPIADNNDEKREQPWRYLGYPAFSKFLASDDDAFIVRRFGTLHARSILMLQWEISRLEQALDHEDQSCLTQSLSADNQYLANSNSFLLDEQYRPKRTAILSQLIPLLERYDRLVWYYSELKARPAAPKRVVKNVKNWLVENEGAIADAESQFVGMDKDLIAMVHREKTPLRRMLEYFRWFRLARCFRSRKDQAHQYTTYFYSDTTTYYSDTFMDMTVTVIILLLGLGMLLGPAWWLQKAGSLSLRLSIICIFVPVFMLLLTAVAPLRPFETVAATSAYTAVLMVFMQLGANSHQSS